MFTITSNRASSEWSLQPLASGGWVLGPAAFRETYFFDDYSEEVEAVVKELEAITARMVEEEERIEQSEQSESTEGA